MPKSHRTAAACAALLMLAGCGRSDGLMATANQGDRPSTSEAAAATGLPRRLVAWHNHWEAGALQQRLAVMDPVSGAVLRELDHGLVTAVDLDPVRDVAYVQMWPTRLVRIPLIGDGQPESVSTAVEAFALSQDGSRLAYLSGSPANTYPGGGNRIVVRDLESGAERVWTTGRDIPVLGQMQAQADELGVDARYVGVRSLTWGPDNRTLAFLLDGTILVLDTQAPGASITDARRWPAPDGSKDHAIVFLGRTGHLAVSRHRLPGPGAFPRGELVKIDPATGASISLMPKSFPATWDTRLHAGAVPVGSDETGRHLLLTTGWALDGAPEQLYRMTDQQTPVRLGEDFRDADW